MRLGTIFLAAVLVTVCALFSSCSRTGTSGDKPSTTAQGKELVAQLSREEFERNYDITYAIPGYLPWEKTDYVKPYVAPKDDSPYANSAYNKKMIDLAGIRSPEDFAARNNDRHARNRIFYDSEYDAESYQDTAPYCLDATLEKVNNIHGKDGSPHLEYYIKHWIFYTGDQDDIRSTIDMGEKPTESDPASVITSPGTGPDQTIDAFFYYNRHSEQECIYKGQMFGFVSQMVENDTGRFPVPGNRYSEILDYFSSPLTGSAGSYDAALWFFVEVIELFNEFMGEIREDDPGYPVSHAFTWGALKRLKELQEDSLTMDVVAYGIPKTPDYIVVEDYWRDEAPCRHGTMVVPPECNYTPENPCTTERWMQYCLDGWGPTDAVTEGSTHYEQRFKLPSNKEETHADLHYRIRLKMVDEPWFSCSSFAGMWVPCDNNRDRGNLFEAIIMISFCAGEPETGDLREDVTFPPLDWLKDYFASSHGSQLPGGDYITQDGPTSYQMYNRDTDTVRDLTLLSKDEGWYFCVVPTGQGR